MEGLKETSPYGGHFYSPGPDGGKFFLFKYYPRMEIFESNDKGEIENIYWFKTGYNYIGRDLFVVHRNGRRYFVTLQVFPEERVEVYSVSDDASS